jgi:hypothetical protein
MESDWKLDLFALLTVTTNYNRFNSFELALALELELELLLYQLA